MVLGGVFEQQNRMGMKADLYYATYSLGGLPLCETLDTRQAFGQLALISMRNRCCWIFDVSGFRDREETTPFGVREGSPNCTVVYLSATLDTLVRVRISGPFWRGDAKGARASL